MIKKYCKGSISPPIQDEIRAVVTTTENGVDIVQFLPYDFSKVDNGDIFSWSFANLASAGITPPVMAGFSNDVNNVESSIILESFSSNLDNILNSNSKE